MAFGWNNIKMNNVSEPKLPVLLFLLENNKFHQILRAMMNPTVTNTMLSEYGEQPHTFTAYEERKIKNSLAAFSIKEILELKGSRLGKSRDYYDQLLVEMLKRKLRMEVPEQADRLLMWTQFTNYPTQLPFYKSLQQLEVPRQFQIAIQKDILRTKASPKVLTMATAVLSAYSLRNPYVGYTQGMNFIVAFLLSEGLREQQCFFVLQRVIQVLLPPDYYTNMDGVMANTRIFYELLSLTHPRCYERMKKIAETMDSNFVATVSFVFQWFVCLFTSSNLPVEVTRTIWDYLLIEGASVLFRAGLALFDFLEPAILKCHDYESYMKIERDILPTIVDCSHIRKRIEELTLSETLLRLLKEKITQQAKSENPLEKPRAERKIFKECNLESNVCMHAVERRIDRHYYDECFVFKQRDKVDVITDYLEKTNKHYFNYERNPTKSKCSDLMVGRIDHICRPASETITSDSFCDEMSEKNMMKNRSPKSEVSVFHSPAKEAEQAIRMRVAEKLNEAVERKPGMQRSESVVFMQTMVKNASISALLEFYDIDEMFSA